MAKNYQMNHYEEILKRNREWERINKRWRGPKRRSYQKEYMRSTRSDPKCMLKTAKRSARERGLGFDLSLDWIVEHLASGRCEVTGIPFSTSCNKNTSRDPFQPSIDRKDSSIGYTPENCQVVCLIYNFAKNNATHQDVVRLARAIVGIEKEVEDLL